jgi:predicted nuclease of predicted toxin-antitoxin system
MKFLVDAQLPRLLAIRLNELGHEARHTLGLSKGNQTPDREISSLADRDSAVVITKDVDFVDSHVLTGKPARLLLVSTGNINNQKLLALFEAHLNSIVTALEASNFVEITASGLVLHD